MQKTATMSTVSHVDSGKMKRPRVDHHRAHIADGRPLYAARVDHSEAVLCIPSGTFVEVCSTGYIHTTPHHLPYNKRIPHRETVRAKSVKVPATH